MNPPTLSTTELIAALRDRQKALNPLDRIILWDAISEGYCLSCGKEHPPNRYCQCAGEA